MTAAPIGRFRKGAEGRAALVRGAMKAAPFLGDVFRYGYEAPEMS